MFAVDTSMVDIQLALNVWDEYESSSGGGGGAYARDKNTSAKLCTKKAGGAYARGGAYLRDTTVKTHSLQGISFILRHSLLSLDLKKGSPFLSRDFLK